MRNTSSRLAALAALILLSGCQGLTGGDPTVAPATPHGAAKVHCSIAPSQPQFKTGEPILISVAVRNVSDSPVNVAFWGRQNECPIVNFRIHGPSGNALFVSTKQNLWCRTGVENVPIPTNREYKVSVDLLKTWEWGGAEATIPPGKYTISAELFSTTPDGGSPKVTESGQTQFTVVAEK